MLICFTLLQYSDRLRVISYFSFVRSCPRGYTRNLHDGGSDVFFGSKISTLGICLGQEIRRVFFSRHTDFISSLTQNHAEEDYV